MGRKPSPCPTCAAGSRSIRATALFWRRRAVPKRSRLTVQQIPIHTHPMLASERLRRTATIAPIGITGQRRATLITMSFRVSARVNAESRRCMTPGRRQPAAHQLPAVSSASISSFHSSAFSRHQVRRKIMADPFVAEIRIFGFNFAPTGWAKCNGQILPISQNTALFSLLGTTYGGNGKSTFALPDMQGSAPMHPGQGPGLSLA